MRHDLEALGATKRMALVCAEEKNARIARAATVGEELDRDERAGEWVGESEGCGEEADEGDECGEHSCCCCCLWVVWSEVEC